MNWQTYKSLTPKQRSEYNYRWGRSKQKIYFFSTLWLMICFALFSVYSLFVMLVYLVNTQEALFSTAETINSMLPQLNIYFNYTIIGLVILLIWEAVNLIILQAQYYKWKKKNNIVYKWWWQNNE